MKKYLYFWALYFITLSVYSQKENSNWLFGHNAGITFNNDGTIAMLYGSGMNTPEGSACISDANGSLLFYTDGRSVWDRNHIIMPGGNYSSGTGLYGDPSSTQSAIIIPKEGDPNTYYIFTVDEPHHQNASEYPKPFTGNYVNPAGSVPADDDGLNNGLNYSVVSLSASGANGSIGDVVLRNRHLVTYNASNSDEIRFKCSEKVSAVRNKQGNGYWLITHFIDKFYAFQINSSGVSETPVITQIAPMVPLSGYRRNGIGALKVSPNGKKIVVAHNQKGTALGGESPNGGVYLYDFDNLTGIVSNPVTVSENTTPYGVEFSPEAKKLYVSYTYNFNFGGQHQYDLLSTNIAASDVLIGADNEGMFQLAPNGKIYMARVGSQFLAVINNPEADGFLCGFDMFGQYMDNYMTGSIGLPQFFAKESVILSTDVPLADKFAIFPNPASTTITIKSTADIAVKTLLLMDSNGRILKQMDSNLIGDGVIDISGLSTGVYYLQIQTSAGAFMHKMLKE